ncbi:MAG: T9SS C-terminal target domain-containing protein [Gemmatimonadetes bacterium]|nr:MAG: T9SS C-terminal target domain-containing protein [Gemmatimonadota bacterium]
MIRNLFILWMVFPTLIWAYSFNPPNGRTGAPGQETCNAPYCHNSYELNEGDGMIEFVGPDEFNPEETYTITIRVSDPGQSRWGFQVTPLDLGSIELIDTEYTRLEDDGGDLYVEHTAAGTYNGTPDGPVEWSFDWTAPTEDEAPIDVTFYVAANAANANGQPSGDYIYTQHFVVDLSNTGIEDEFNPAVPATPLKLSNYPNPFNPRTTIRYAIPTHDHVTLGIYNITGQLVRIVVDQPQAPGEYSILWDGTDDRGQSVESGLYLYRLETNTQSVARTMVLLR